jgi:hypothetical protein
MHYEGRNQIFNTADGLPNRCRMRCFMLHSFKNHVVLFEARAGAVVAAPRARALEGVF